MEWQEPWQDYRRDHLPRGWSHVLGRDDIAAALRGAGARVKALSLGRADGPAEKAVHSVFDVYFYGDASPGSFTAATPRTDLLLMRWSALPAVDASAIAGEVRQLWLPQGCAWAAAAAERGNVWAAREHRWQLRLDRGSLRATET